MITRRGFIAAGMSAALGMSLLGCGVTGLGGSAPINNYLDDDTLEFMLNWALYTPATLTYQQLYETTQSFGVKDLSEMKRVHDALMNIKVGNETTERDETKREFFTFGLPSGKAFYVEFNMRHLVAGDKCYEISNDDELWQLADEIVKTASSDGLARDAKDAEDVTTPETPSSAEQSAGQDGDQSSGQGAGQAEEQNSGQITTQSTGQDEAQSSAQGTEAAESPAQEPDQSTAEASNSGETREPTQWIEPVGKTTDGRIIETTVTSN